MPEDRIAKLEQAQDSHSIILNRLEKDLAILITRTDDHFTDGIKTEKRLRTIDNNVNAIMMSIATMPANMENAHRGNLDSIWQVVRKHDEEFHDFKTEARIGCENTVKASLRNIGAILAFSFLIVSSLIGLIVKDMHDDIINNEKTIIANKKDVDSHHNKKHRLGIRVP